MVTKAKSEVAVKDEQAVGFYNGDDVPEYLRGSQGRGSEEVGSKDITLPRLEIVQAQSPIKDQVEDARDGMLYNSATMDLIGDTAYFVNVFYRMEYLVWKDSDAGGGFFGSYPTEADANARRAEVVAGGEDPDLIEVTDTPVHFGLLVFPDGRPSQQIVISMPKSKSKVSRKWNSMIQIVGGDRFSRVYRIGTFTDKNKQNKTFKNFTVQPAGFAPEPVYREAEKLYELFKQQGVKADHESVVIDAEGDAETMDRGGI